VSDCIAVIRVSAAVAPLAFAATFTHFEKIIHCPVLSVAPVPPVTPVFPGVITQHIVLRVPQKGALSSLLSQAAL